MAVEQIAQAEQVAVPETTANQLTFAGFLDLGHGFLVEVLLRASRTDADRKRLILRLNERREGRREPA